MVAFLAVEVDCVDFSCPQPVKGEDRSIQIRTKYSCCCWLLDPHVVKRTRTAIVHRYNWPLPKKVFLLEGGGVCLRVQRHLLPW